jgi:hypothetical protein
MNAYRSIRLWQLKPGAPAGELEELVTSGVIEMQRWIPGVQHLSLMRLAGEPPGRYLVITTFSNYEAYRRLATNRRGRTRLLGALCLRPHALGTTGLPGRGVPW